MLLKEISLNFRILFFGDTKGILLNHTRYSGISPDFVTRDDDS